MRSVWCEAWGVGFKMWGVRYDMGLRCEVWSVRYWVRNVCLFLWLVHWQQVLRKWGSECCSNLPQWLPLAPGLQTVLQASPCCNSPALAPCEPLPGDSHISGPQRMRAIRPQACNRDHSAIEGGNRV